MAYSYTAFTGNGSTTQYAVSFPYIRREHVAVTVAGVPSTFTWVNNSLIQMDAAPANGAAVRVYRTTPISAPLVDFADGATLVAADLDTNSRQSIYIQQELDDAQTDNLPNVIPNGNKGDITTSVGGTVWAINNGAVTEAKIGTGAVTSGKIADGTIVDADVNASAGITAGKLSFTQAGTGATARTVDSKLKDAVSVKDFGAVGNGVADDTAAFAAAIAASDAVEVPDGSYVISTLTGKSNLQLTAKGKAKLIHKGSAAVGSHLLKFRDCNNWLLQGFEIDGNKANQSNNVNTVYVENNSQKWVIDGCYIHDAKVFGVLIAEDSLKPQNWTIQNTQADLCGDSGFACSGASQGRFVASSAQQNTAQGFALQGDGSYITMTDCLATGNLANGFFFGRTNNCSAINCYSTSNGSGPAGGSGFGFNTSFAVSCYKNSVIACIATSNSDDGVDINNAAGPESSDHKIIGCRFEANNAGINCINSSNNIFEANTIIASRINGIHLQAASRNVVTGNRLLNGGTLAANTYHGIYVDASSNNNIISENISTNDGGAANQRFGIYLDTGATGNVVTSNDTSGNATGGINDDGTATVFDNNRAYEAPSFSAYQLTSQTIAHNTETKVQFTAAKWNTRSLYSTANSRFTPKQIGKYQLNASVMFTSAVDQKMIDVYIKKNGSTYVSNGRIETSGTGYHAVSTSFIVEVTSAADYFEIFTFHTAGVSLSIANDASQTIFCGHKLPQ